MEILIGYKKGRNRGIVAIWTNAPDTDSQDLIQKAKKVMKDQNLNIELTGDEKWSIVRNPFG